MIACPPFLNHDEQRQSKCRDAEVDGNLRIRPRDLAPSEFDREKGDDQKRGKQDRPEEVYSPKSLENGRGTGFELNSVVPGLGIR